MTPNALLSDISSGKFKPAYYFFGSEDYRITEAEKFVAKKFLPKEQLVTNYRRINGKKIRCDDLIAELSVYPMLGERQVFAITDFQQYKPTEIKRILALLKPPDPNRIIVLSSPSAKTPKKTSALMRDLSAVAATVEFGKLDDKQARSNIVAQMKRAGLGIEPDALEKLVELLHGNRGALEAEADKLISYKNGDGGGDKLVTLADVKATASGYEMFSVFELADLVVERNLPKTLRLVDNLMAGGVSATGLVYQLGQHFLSLYKVKNGNQLEVYRRWLMPKFKNQAERYGMTELENNITLLAETDADLRRTGVSERSALESLVVRLIERPT